MFRSSYIGVFRLLFVLHFHTASGIAWNKPFQPQDGAGGQSVLALLGEGLPTEVITSDNTETIFGLLTQKPREASRQQLLSNFKGSSTSLEELAAGVTEILERISRNWALEGAKTIQNGEIQLRKLKKDVAERIEELLSRGSTIGLHVQQCMNKTVFEMGLNEILNDTNQCYSESLRSVQVQLEKIENEKQAVLVKLDRFGKEIFDMLSECFSREDTPSVIECLQKVDSVHAGSHIREVEGTNLLLEMAGVVNDIPRAVAGCTSKALAEVEAHVRKSYAQSLTCLKGNVT